MMIDYEQKCSDHGDLHFHPSLQPKELRLDGLSALLSSKRFATVLKLPTLSHNSWYTLVLVLAVTTLLMVLFHQFIPKKRLDILSLPKFNPYTISDELDGGASRSAWLDRESLKFSCNFQPSATAGYCGMRAELANSLTQVVDLSGFDQLDINLSYEGPARKLRMGIGTMLPSLDASETSGVVLPTQYILSSGDLNKDTTIFTKHFKPSDWWLVQKPFSSEQAVINLKRAVTMGIDILSDNPIYTHGKHTVQINKVELVGDWISANELNRLLLVSWIAFLIVFTVSKFLELTKENLLRSSQIERLSETNTELRQKSLTDPLTGLLNRAGFNERTPEASSENKDFKYSLIVMDLDHFKAVNDTYGHNEGDKVLVESAQILKLNTRRSDVCARWGGEEFLMLLPQTSGKNAAELANKIRTQVAKLSEKSDLQAKITASFGVAESTSKETFHDVFRRADKALYAAKSSGRNQVTLLEHQHI